MNDLKKVMQTLAELGDVFTFQVKNTLVDKRMISKKLCRSFLITYVEYINGKHLKGTSTSHHLDFKMRATFLILFALIGTTWGM